MSGQQRKSLPFQRVSVGDELPPLEIPLTPTVIMTFLAFSFFASCNISNSYSFIILDPL